MPRGVPKHKTVTAGEPVVIDMTATQVASINVDDETASPVVGEEAGFADTPVSINASRAYYVLTLVNDHTRDLVKRLERSGMDFQIVEMSENDMKDIRNQNLLFLPKS